MREANLRRRLRDKCSDAYLLGVSDRVHKGRPDFLWLRKYDKAVGWLELKTGSTLSKAQHAFLDLWISKGGRAGLLVGHKDQLVLTNWVTGMAYHYTYEDDWPNLIFREL